MTTSPFRDQLTAQAHRHPTYASLAAAVGCSESTARAHVNPSALAQLTPSAQWLVELGAMMRFPIDARTEANAPAVHECDGGCVDRCRECDECDEYTLLCERCELVREDTAPRGGGGDLCDDCAIHIAQRAGADWREVSVWTNLVLTERTITDTETGATLDRDAVCDEIENILMGDGIHGTFTREDGASYRAMMTHPVSGTGPNDLTDEAWAVAAWHIGYLGVPEAPVDDHTRHYDEEGNAAYREHLTEIINTASREIDVRHNVADLADTAQSGRGHAARQVRDLIDDPARYDLTDAGVRALKTMLDGHTLTDDAWESLTDGGLSPRYDDSVNSTWELDADQLIRTLAADTVDAYAQH